MAQEASLTPEHLKAVLKEFCRRNGGGHCSINVGPARYGGVYAVLVWSGFDEMEVSERQVRLWKFLRGKLSSHQRSLVSVIYAQGVREKAEEDTLRSLHEADLPWMRPTSDLACP